MSLSEIYSTVFQPLYGFFDTQNQVDAEEAFIRIEQEAQYLDQMDRKPMWSGFSREPISSLCPSVEKALSQFEKEGIQDKTAVDLGCGKASSTLYLLQKGWKVIAIDYSQEALDRLKEIANRKNPSWIQDEKLTCVCEDIETYQLPPNLNLIVTSKVLPYIHPLKIRHLWDKLHNSLAEGGRLVGDFFPAAMTRESKLSFVQRAIMNAWFTDIAAVRGLLSYKNFQNELCKHSNFWFSSNRGIEFIARKTNTKASRNGFFTLHLSSYFDAVRGLPLKSHPTFPFLIDRLIELREAAKFTIFASGAIALTQSLFNFDTSLASYTFVGSIAAWFFSKQIAAWQEPKVKEYIKRIRSLDYTQSAELKRFKQSVGQIQNHPEIKRTLNPGPPPPPLSPQEKLRAILEGLGINPSQSEIIEKPAV